MELTKNTSVDPSKMLGKNYIEAVNAKFPNTILDEEWSTPNQVTLTIKTNMLPDVVEYRYLRIPVCDAKSQSGCLGGT